LETAISNFFQTWPARERAKAKAKEGNIVRKHPHRHINNIGRLFNASYMFDSGVGTILKNGEMGNSFILC
jgi:hypothetical protein